MAWLAYLTMVLSTSLARTVMMALSKLVARTCAVGALIVCGSLA